MNSQLSVSNEPSRNGVNSAEHLNSTRSLCVNVGADEVQGDRAGLSNLAQNHVEFLRASAIDDEVILERGYRTITVKARLEGLGFAKSQWQVPTLLVPIHGASGDLTTYQHRPDAPRIRDGKPLEYESISGHQLIVDVPLRCREWLNETQRALFLTDSITGADSAASKGLCCISLLNVWRWDSKCLPPELANLALASRQIYVAIDSVTMAKEGVHKAVVRLKALVEAEGGSMNFICLPADECGRKIGLGGFFAAGGSVAELVNSAESDLKPLPGIEDADHDNGSGLLSGSFRVTQKGVEYCEDTDEGDKTWVQVCSPLEIVALTRSEQSVDWGRLLALKDSDGVRHEWAMPMALMGARDGAAYRSELLSMGFTIEPGRQAVDLLHRYIQTTTPEARALAVSRIGWHGDVFVLPDEVYGNSSNERVVYQTASKDQKTFEQTGTLEQWQKHIGRFCVGNSRLAFAVCVALAAPLLYLTEDESGGFHYRGDSSQGKTTALIVGGSVCGGGGIKGYLRSWRATANGLEGAAIDHCDMLLCLDEISQVSGKDAAEVAYMLANGTGKTRSRRDGSARKPSEWRLLFLSSGELSLGDKISEDGGRVMAGQEVRVVDIPADAAAGLGLFEDLHGFANGETFSRYLKEAAGKYFGTPIRAFLDKLTEDPDAIAQVKQFRDKCQEALCPEGADGQVQRVALRFSLVAAAGELATEMKILPWKRGDATKAALKCFEAWLLHRGTIGPAEIQAAINQVTHFFQVNGESRFTPWSGRDFERDTPNRAGFRKGTDGATEFYVFPEVFRKEICKGLDPTLVKKALVSRGLLVLDSEKKPPKVRLPGTTKQTRMYHFPPEILGCEEDD